MPGLFLTLHEAFALQAIADAKDHARPAHRKSDRGLQVDVGGVDIELAADDVRELNDVLVKQPVRGARYYEQLMEMVATRDGHGPHSLTEPRCGYRGTTHMFLDSTP